MSRPSSATQASGAPRASGYQGPPGRAVQDMFGAIAHRYDLLNHLLSLSVDKRWRRQVIRLLRSLAPRSGDACLDLCAGTGDLALEIAGSLELPVVAADFCHPMLVRSGDKIRAAGRERQIRLAGADALRLPFADASFRFVTVAFGVRNVESLEGALAEMRRVLRPGGAVVILEFSRPVLPVFRQAFQFYFRRVLPRIGTWISGARGPYQYLPDSVARFPAQRELAELMRAAGFADVRYRNLTGGVAAMHWGVKGAEDAARPKA